LDVPRVFALIVVRHRRKIKRFLSASGQKTTMPNRNEGYADKRPGERLNQKLWQGTIRGQEKQSRGFLIFRLEKALSL